MIALLRLCIDKDQLAISRCSLNCQVRGMLSASVLCRYYSNSLCPSNPSVSLFLREMLACLMASIGVIATYKRHIASYI